MEKPAWWQETTIYQIYPRSFFDANGDGIGDLQGIIQKLDYIYDLGFETIWLSPHYQSPQRDFGYDITDYFSIAPEYGTMDDALQLIKEVHDRGMKIIFDMILNHTSDEHPWFQQSRSALSNAKRDWYIWRDGRGPNKPPNNWSAIPGGSGWKYDHTTGQWYFHNFLDFQPDLNFRNPEVKKAMFDTVRFWLDKGVDGYRLDIFHAIFKDEGFKDNPSSWRYIPNADFDEGFFQKLKYNINRPEAFALAKEVRQVVDEYTPQRFIIGEVFGKGVVKKYLGDKLDGLHLILQFDLVYLHKVTAGRIHAILEQMEKNYPPPYTPTYALGNHDRRRYFSRIGRKVSIAKLLALFQYTARGVTITYYGDELGLPDGDFPHGKALDPPARDYWWIPVKVAQWLKVYANRDGCRTPMQWSPDPQAGFCPPDKNPWLPVHKNYRACNVKTQKADPHSLWNLHRSLLQLRKNTPALRQGSLENLSTAFGKHIVLYARRYHEQTTVTALNFGTRVARLTLPTNLNQVSRIAIQSHDACIFHQGSLTLPPQSGVVLL